MKKSRINIKDWSGGITADFKKTLSTFGTTAKSSSPNNLGEYNEGTQINLFRGGYLGHLSSIPSLSEYSVDSGGTQNLPIAGLYDTRAAYNENKMFVRVNDKLAYIDLNGGVTTYPGSGLSTNLAGSLLMYTDVSTSQNITPFLQTETGFSTFNGANTQFNATTPSGFSLAGGFTSNDSPVKAIIGPQARMYFNSFNGQLSTIGRYNPAGAGLFEFSYLTLETGYYVQDMCAFGNYVAIIANNRGAFSSRPKLYIWDGLSSGTDPYTDIKEIDDHMALTVHEENGSLLITTLGDGLFKIKKYTGGVVLDTPEFSIDQSLIEPMTATAVQGGLIYNALNFNRIKYFRGMFFIQGFDGKVWSLGRPLGGKFRSGLHCIFAPSLPIYTVSGISYNSAGFIEKNPRKNQLIIGYRSADAIAKIAVLDMDSINSNIFNGTFLTEDSFLTTNHIELPANSTITNITVEFSDFSNSRSGFQLGFYKDNDNITDYLNGHPQSNLVFSNSGQYYRYPINCTINKVDAFYLKLRFSSCSIKSISVSYTYDNLESEG